MASKRNRLLTPLMIAASRTGNGPAWFLLGLAILLLDGDGLLICGRLALGYAINLSVYRIVKSLSGRPRPFLGVPSVTHLVKPPDEFSFPSGHTAGAFVAAVIVGEAFPILLVPMLALACLIGVSRVYLGVHYPTDVAAGAVLGVASGTAGYLLI